MICKWSIPSIYVVIFHATTARLDNEYSQVAALMRELAQQLGRERWYRNYQVEIARIDRSYRLTCRPRWRINPQHIFTPPRSHTMRLPTLLLSTLIALPLATHAADEPNKQQNKMAQCNQEAGDKKGPERKAFMSDCLKNKQKAQREKMKACNQDAAGKKGDERKAFMSDCLKK